MISYENAKNAILGQALSLQWPATYPPLFEGF